MGYILWYCIQLIWSGRWFCVLFLFGLYKSTLVSIVFLMYLLPWVILRDLIFPAFSLFRVLRLHQSTMLLSHPYLHGSPSSREWLPQVLPQPSLFRKEDGLPLCNFCCEWMKHSCWYLIYTMCGMARLITESENGWST